MGSIDTSKYSEASNKKDARIGVAEVSDKEIKDELNHEDVGNTLGEEPSVLLFVASSFGHALECQLLTSVNDEMGSIDTSKYSEASENEDSSDIAEAIDKAIKDELTDEDMGDTSDEDPPFNFEFRGKVVAPTAGPGNNLRKDTKKFKPSKPKKDELDDLDRLAKEKKTKK